MGTVLEATGANRRQGRCWRFASAVFDERSWTLTVNGRAVQIENKPLELLHELLLQAGDVIGKDELLDKIWPGVSVVEASLPTAIAKLRRALGDDKRGNRIIETVPRIGYRLSVPVAIEQRAGAAERTRAETDATPTRAPVPMQRRRAAIAAALLIAMLFGGLIAAQIFRRLNPSPPAFTQADAATAIRKLDLDRIEALLRAGWNPNTPFDDQGNGAINIALNICEWDRGHDKERLVLLTRTLLEGGARLDARNVWGDTAYSIAKAPRYCGPDHPVTRMIHDLCYGGFRPTGDRCLASYETSRPSPKGKGK